MTEISGEDFKQKITSNEKSFSDLTIKIEHKTILQMQSLNFELTFKNVIFKGESLVFHDRNSEDPLNRFCVFDNCTFFCDILFSSCSFKYLKFISSKINNKSFQIANCKVENLLFEENNENFTDIIPTIVESGYLKINGGKIRTIDIENIIFNNGSLGISNLNYTESCSIIKSTLNTVVFTHCIFNSYFHYIGNKVISNANKCFFNHCNFSSSSFFETNFNDDTHFNNCTFNNPINFQSINNEINGNFRFTSCDFTKFTDFDKSKIHKIKLDKIKFHDFVSFQETYFDIIEIDKTNFEKGAFFDDIQIKKIEDCNRRTIRTIKQQLQKAENRIDFNRFRAYELAAHYKELDWKWNSGFIDKSILYVTKISTDFGNSWRKALRFTIVSGFLIYLILYFIENRNFLIDFLNWDNWARLFSGFFRFLLVTDFYNPLETDRVYLTNPFSWLIFIFGKIVIAFGIYEMIQSFRKFKA
ncbi:hypothetical protein [Flavobacterium hibisci]|uniref:hypothetical protein n=1 Tax=Flavobacterium hibisci TaxID=1914462 RepID=UPI001CC028C4|nr:hypothetical protein [Flavobacterium hibisci]MBZ4043375.1 hypothetical protein [Flavobacterium hibisci]